MYEKEIRQAIERNYELFHKRMPNAKIIVCGSVSEFKKHAGRFYQDFATAITTTDEKIIIKCPDLIEKEGKWKRKDFVHILTHEMNHLLWHDMKKTWSPYWLCEGIACYVDGSFRLTNKEMQKMIKKHDVDSSILDFRYIIRHFDKGHAPRYQVWTGFTVYLVKKYGMKKIREVMKENKKEGYELKFKKTFGKTDKQIFDEYMQVING